MKKISKAKLIINGKIMSFPFNPEKFRKAVGIEYSEIKSAGTNYPINQFSGGKTAEITFDIYLNAREGHDVKGFIAFLNDGLPYERYTPPFNVPPPDVIFAYGWFVKRCKIKEFTTDYTMFDRDLNPLEAKINLTLIIVP
ncbi:MAG: hypothetical protein H0Z24_05930 [Thermosipho sp. (in: Bacteria)]|nr:hypothetical protein [Thermosipho sp. (in: thermotogales)]